MKKLLFLLMAILFVGVTYGQGTKKVSELNEDVSISGGEYTYTVENGRSYKMSTETILNAAQDSVAALQEIMNDSLADLRADIENSSSGEYWNYRGGYSVIDGTTYRSYMVYPFNSKVVNGYMGVFLGSLPPTSYLRYHLYVDGLTFLGDTTQVTVLQFENGITVFDSIGQIWFRDSYQKSSLSGLTALPSSLTSTWSMEMGTYDMNLYDPSGNGLYWDYSTSIMTLKMASYLNVDAEYLTTDSINARAIRGEEMYTDGLTLNDERITDWNQISGSGGFGGVYVEGSKTGRTSIKLMGITSLSPTYNGNDTLDAFDFYQDTTVVYQHMRTTPITAANINNGDILTVVEAPGTDTTIVVSKVLFYTSGNTDATGSGTSYLYRGSTALADFSDAQLGATSAQTYSFWEENVTGGNQTYAATSSFQDTAITLDLYDGYSGTNRAGWVKVWYYIIIH